MTTTARRIAAYLLRLVRPAGRRRKTGHYMSVQRRTAVLDAEVERANVGRITTAEYLAQLGADAAFINSYASPYGRAVAKAYRSAFGVEPAKSGLARRGMRLVPVFAYTADEADVLYEAAYFYQRTRELLAGQRAAALHALAA